MKRRSLLYASLLGVSFVGLVLATAGSVMYQNRSLAPSKYYTRQTTGYDISFPQCASRSLPTGSFGIVGATGGRAFTANSCLASEYRWAQVGTRVAPSLYMNLNYPSGTTASQGHSGPAGTCTGTDMACQAYNYGYNAAAYAFNQGITFTMWWIDIETENSWSDLPSLNDEVIEGAVDFIQGHGATAGIYSTPSMWSSIAGKTFQPGTIPIPGGKRVGVPVVANWVPGGSDSSCAGASTLYPNGKVWLVQYASSPYDADYAC
jgi:hypothetical protein